MAPGVIKKIFLAAMLFNSTFFTPAHEQDKPSAIKTLGVVKFGREFDISGAMFIGFTGGLFALVAYRYFKSRQLDSLLNQLPVVHKMIDKSFKDFIDEELEEAYAFINKSYAGVTGFQSLPVPQCIISQCKAYYEQIPPYACDTLAKAMADVGIVTPVFFYQTLGNNHAMHGLFDRIGLHPRTLAILNPEYRSAFDSAGQTSTAQYNFFQTLYHELCHIKGNHGTNFITLLTNAKINFLVKNKNLLTSKSDEHALQQKWAIDLVLYQSPPENASYLYGLFEEMEAELGAIYYMMRLHNYDANARIMYLEDDDHPSNKDQKRFNAKLLKQLKIGPTQDYSIVKELAKRYLLEKEPWFENFFALEQPIPPVASLIETYYENNNQSYATVTA